MITNFYRNRILVSYLKPVHVCFVVSVGHVIRWRQMVSPIKKEENSDTGKDDHSIKDFEIIFRL